MRAAIEALQQLPLLSGVDVALSAALPKQSGEPV